ncbi:MAG: tetratricopeptide repeat protein [Nitrospirae bacterium]|nr:tetratricopeptide repeat protein [Nitrospirota bacterium]
MQKHKRAKEQKFKSVEVKFPRLFRERVRERGTLRVIIFLALLAFIASLVSGAFADNDPSSIFKNGNQLYESGKYDEAIREYSRLLAQGVESGNLYFNLGNSYFKKGETGRAILNYERAKRLMPDDSDLRSNYNYALSRTENTGQQSSASMTEKISGIFSGLTINGLTIFVSAVYVLILAIFIAIIFFPAVKRYLLIMLGVLSVIFLLSTFSLYSRVMVLDSEAIVVSKNAEAKFEPLDNATTHFTLYEGMKIFILESKHDWSKVERFDGKSGWIRNQELEKI